MTLAIVWALVQKHWRGIGLAGALLGAFVGGRLSAPKCKTPAIQSSTVSTSQTQTHTAQNAAEQTTEQKNEHRVKITHRDIVRKPDGSSEEKDEVDETNGTDDHITENLQVAKQTQQDSSQVTRQTISVTPRSDAPRWSLGLGIGAPVALKAPFFGVPFGLAEVSYRFLGPLEATLWGSSDFKLKRPELGVMLGVSF